MNRHVVARSPPGLPSHPPPVYDYSSYDDYLEDEGRLSELFYVVLCTTIIVLNYMLQTHASISYR